MSVYIHIPFCKNICSYCDFCKVYYNSNLVDKYLNTLEKEIKLNYKGEVIETIYIGGGTPSALSEEQLTKLLNILKIFNTSNLEYTIECNIDDITESKIKIFKEFGINRISVGVQTFNDKYIKFLNRKHNKHEVFEKMRMLKKYINNINIDLIYAIPGQTLEELKEDIDCVLSLDISHISTYSLIIEEHTKLYIDDVQNIDESLDYEMYKLICSKLKDHGYNHYEISNFSKEGYESRHNLVYWNNKNYYGFGLGASGYIGNMRYENTRSINNYFKEIYVLNKHELNIDETIENEFMLGLRKIKGINKDLFYEKYGIDIYDIKNVKEMIQEKKLIDDKENIYINSDYLYVSNDILVKFID